MTTTILDKVWLKVLPKVWPKVFNLFGYKYNFSNADLKEAIIEQVNRQSVITNTNASDRHIVQLDGTVQTFTANTNAFKKGVGTVIQAAATNLFPNGCTATGWTARGTGSITTSTVDAPIAGYKMMKVIINENGAGGNPQNDAYFINANCTANASIALSFFMQKITNGRVVLGNASSGLYGTWVVDMSLLGSGIERIHRNHPAVILVTAEFAGNPSGKFGILSRSDATFGEQQYRVFAVQAEQNGSYTNYSSPIVTIGAAASRLTDSPTISTFLEKGEWLDNKSNCVLGSLSTSGYTNGFGPDVGSGITGYMTFDGTTPGKYKTKLNAGIVGAILTSTTGVVLRVTGFYNSSTFIYACIYNPTGLSYVDAIMQGFGNTGNSLNPFTIDFTTSAYFTGNFVAATTTISALRTLAGDDVNTLRPAKLWPVNNFELNMEVEILQDISTMSVNSGLLAQRYDVSNRFQISTNIFLPNAITFAGISNSIVLPDLVVTLPTPIVRGTNLVLSLIKTSTYTSLTVNGVTSTNSDVTDLVIKLPVSNLMKKLNSDQIVPGIIKRFNIREI